VESMQGERTEVERQRSKIESALVAGAVGGLVGLLVGPVATLLCAASAAALGYVKKDAGRACLSTLYRRQGR
jgi:hypothetical protein